MSDLRVARDQSVCGFKAPPVEQHEIQEGLAEKANLSSPLAVPFGRAKLRGELTEDFGMKHQTCELCLVGQDEVLREW